MPSRRSLARTLEAVSDFRDPDPGSEQYLTPPEIAAHVCHLAALRGDFDDRYVIDLGTGTGMLAIGAALAGATRPVGIEADRTALDVARENATAILDDAAVAWIRADATRVPLALEDATVLSNPPFGAQHGNRHADRAFLETAREIAAVSYTIHNEGSLDFLESFAADADATVTDAFQATIDLPNQFGFHEDERRTLETVVVRIEWS